MADREAVTATPDQFVQQASDDWPAKASATIVQYVGTVRDKTTGPALSASRVAVYALAMGLIALVLAFLALILLVRVLVVATGYVPGVGAGETWLAYYILGALFMLPGLFLWRKKER
ncbi:MAG: hypothetical protein AAFN30_09365 [Actinomycetota bacterium]